MIRSAMQLHPERKLLATHVESWLDRLDSDTDLNVDLGRWRSSGMHADAYMQGLLSLVLRQGGRVDVRIPSTSFAPGRLEAALRTPDVRDGPDRLTSSERLLGGTLGGLIVGHLGTLDRPEIPLAQRAELDRREHIFGFGPERAIARLVDPGGTRRPNPANAPKRMNNLRRRLRQLADAFGVAQMKPMFGTSTQPTRTWEWMFQFAFEALENTNDHGAFDLQGETLRMVRFVQLRRIPVLHSQGLGPLTRSAEAATAHYLKRLAASERSHRPSWSLIEVTVGDGGLGIPAWIAHGVDIYERPHQEEMKRLREALLPDATTKSLWESGRGLGFTKMLQAAHHLDGLVMVRTGRCAISRTYLDADGQPQRVDFDDGGSDAYVVDEAGELPLTAGTVVTLLYPYFG
ncbi:MAG: hypothetical protein QOK28_2176 [Actinomycetota bacterium]|jgi:hypothetical protein